MNKIIPSGDPVPNLKIYKDAIKSARTDKKGNLVLVIIVLFTVFITVFLIIKNGLK